MPTRVVRATLANLRREPAHASELVSQLVLGEDVEVLEESGDWVQAAGEDGYPGWLHAGSLEVAAVPGPAASLVWTRRDGTLRDGPSSDAATICDLVLGARVEARHESGVTDHDSSAGGGSPGKDGDSPAHAVLLPDRTPAWADASGWAPAFRLAERFPAKADAVVRTALSLRGVPYLWGGTSSKAFDCSGFVQRIYRLHGVPLSRDAHQQAKLGVAPAGVTNGGEIRGGDLIFFAENGDRITHVAIALGQGGRFVHCSTARAGVGLDSLDPSDGLYAPDLAASFRECRRVL